MASPHTPAPPHTHPHPHPHTRTPTLAPTHPHSPTYAGRMADAEMHDDWGEGEDEAAAAMALDGLNQLGDGHSAKEKCPVSSFQGVTWWVLCACMYTRLRVCFSCDTNFAPWC